MNYDEFKVEDFLYDEFFVRWVKNPGPESNHFWESWINNHPEKTETVKQASRLILSVRPKTIYTPSEQEYTDVLEKVLKQQSSWSQSAQRSSNRGSRLWLRYAATIIMVASLSAVFLFFGFSDSFKSNPSPVSTIIKETPLGQKLTFELSDGTLVKLNAGSKLIYQETFDKARRKVYLEGEAFFNVKRDESRPFVVETAQLTTTVLGTSFNVQAYGNEESTVAVLTGKVQVKKSKSDTDSDTFFLTNNQMVTISTETSSISKFDNIPPDLFAWKENVISFSKANFPTIVSSLERWYGVKFILQKHGQFEGLFTGRYANEPLDLVLEGLKDEYNFQFKIDENKKEVLIY